MMNHRYTIVDPVTDALNCTCRTRGGKCVEAQKFDFDFWAEYWKTTVPGVFQEVAKLKAGGASVAAGAAAYLLGIVGPEKVKPAPEKPSTEDILNYNGVQHARHMLNSL